MTNFSINIISDPVCPWCYIGKKRLDRAIALYKKVYPGGRHDTFTVTWQAYYLDASAPVPGIPYEERMLQKIVSSRRERERKRTSASEPRSDNIDVGITTTTTTSNTATDAVVVEDQDRELARQLRGRLANIGRQEGIEFSFRAKMGRTRSAHRAIAFSRSPSAGGAESESGSGSGAEAQDRFVMALFAAFFEGDLDITSHEGLADVAGSVGLGRAEILAWLDGDGGGAEVDGEDRAVRASGVAGVPRFAVRGVGGAEVVDGARDVQEFLELFVKIKEQEQQQQA